MHIKKVVVASFVLISFSSCNAHPLHGLTFFSPRSQSANAARDAVEIMRYRDVFEADKTYGYANITTAYNHSLRAKRIAQALFGTDTLHISGSNVANRCPHDLLADYFGLSPSFNSDVKFVPTIENALVSFDGYIGLDSWVRGLYLEIHVPAIWTKWHLKEHEIVNDPGTETVFPAGYMSEDAIPAPIEQFIDALTGKVTFGEMQDPLKFGKIIGAHAKGGLADLQCACGYNFLLREHGHVGLNVCMAAPTGSRPKSEFAFEPIAGNGKHWEVGVGFNGRVLLWEKDGQQEFSFVGIVNLMHLFRARQHRSFDFKKNGFGSRFILLKQFDKNQQYTGSLTPAINQTTLPCSVRIDLRADIVTMFNYIYNKFSFDVGYNGFIRSKEKINLRGCIPDKQYGFKGVQSVTGQNSNTTESSATVFGVDLTGTMQEMVDKQSAVADNPSPVFIATNDLDLNSASSPRLITHKLFANFGYSWPDKTIPPFIGIGGELEFEGINPRNTAQPDGNTLAQWGIWLKIGARFL